MSKPTRGHRSWHLAARLATFCLACAGTCEAADPLAKLMVCRNLDDAAARLACFDREAAALAAGPIARPSAPPAASPAAAAPPSRAAAVAAAPAPDAAQQFGLPERTVAAQEVAAGTRPAEAKKIEAHVAKFAPGPDGRLVFTLDNDQVWRQLLSEGDLMVNPGDVVTISRGFLGSYWLQTGNGRGCKVTRLH
jgi:pyruvate/2-oxoglutarate dehydrogenase complex dihydrolipoamide acyltransferase (E2) component